MPVMGRGCVDADGRRRRVLQAWEDYRRTEASIEFMRAVIQELADIEAGHEVSLAETRARFCGATMKYRGKFNENCHSRNQ